MHNIVHNMADDLGVSNHLTARAGVYQYVRRVPEDVRAAFPFARVQKSLGTRDQRQARATALDLDRQWDERFNEARQRSGVTVEGFGPAVVSTANWTWPDWEALANWFGASLAEEDWRARLATMKGGVLRAEPDLAHLPWRPDPVVQEHIARRRRFEDIAVVTYAAERLAFVQSYVRRLGVTLSRTEPVFDRFMAECLKAELAYLDLFQLREARRGGLDHSHPDTIKGRWRAAPPSARRTAVAMPAAEAVSAGIASAHDAVLPAQPSGKTLKDCRTKWIDNRVKARKQVRDDYLRDMDATIAC